MMLSRPFLAHICWTVPIAATLVRSQASLIDFLRWGPVAEHVTGICTPSPHFYWSQRFLCEQDARASPRSLPETHLAGNPMAEKDPASHTQTSPCWSRRCPCESLCLASPCKSMQIPLSSPSELPPTDFTCWERSLAPCKSRSAQQVDTDITRRTAPHGHRFDRF